MKNLKENFDVTVTLDYAISIDGVETTFINIRRPKVKDFIIWSREKDDAKKEILMISNLANLTPEEVGELDLKDYKKIADTIADFLSK